MTAQLLAGGKKSLNETVTGRVTLNIVRVDVERKRDDGVAIEGQRRSQVKDMQCLRSQAHSALEVVALSVLDEVVDNQDGDEEDDGLEALEVQSHGLAHDPAKNDKEGCNEERDLHRAANCDVNGQIHLALVCDDDGCDVLGGVSDDGDQDQTDECLADVCRLDDGVDAVDEVFGADGDKDGNDDERNAGSDRGQDLAILTLLISTLLVLDVGEEGVVRVQLEVQVEDVQNEEDDRGAVGQK